MNADTILPPDLDFDLAGLCAAAAPLLAGLPVTDQRIQAVPDARTLRFYQSGGLMDRPARYDGRVARYGRRHLLQVVAVRVLQSQGSSLAQIQAVLAGATDAELAEQAMAITEERPPNRESIAPSSTLYKESNETVVGAELAPGLIVTADSRCHPDPERVIELLRRAIQGDRS